LLFGSVVIERAALRKKRIIIIIIIIIIFGYIAAKLNYYIYRDMNYGFGGVTSLTSREDDEK
jgi:hypothetical protein